ncbi:uncharacterized protein LOC107318173 [Coturnix japonica]|uniref:uncharacterized protein LOC107318173 n=1 Tax=Coturnix japonica TaxID=93934 RepID=UPI0007771375|nr:uncharacterized protein LOC107318173 [Coturnix japonica]XP_015727169.1 uncharacterized protein LOC107318173 [Coturnix japonica]XP_015727171.1 uncharacterized protein LOC107318173 [Coturnix japonica]
MASEEPGSPADQTSWEFLNLLNTLGIQNGELLVMEMKDVHVRAPSVLLRFAQDLFSAGSGKTELQQIDEKEEEKEVQPLLVFMVWQATTLKHLMQWDYLDETLFNIRNLFPYTPAVVVLVLVHSGPQEELSRAVEALRRMQCLLDGAFRRLVVEAAVYKAGQPNGIQEVKKAACRALEEVFNHKGNRSLDPISAHPNQPSPQQWIAVLSVCHVRYHR